LITIGDVLHSSAQLLEDRHFRQTATTSCRIAPNIE
jgi:hypothetical protein